ncbi:tryptophan synthase subunit alpha [Bacillus sp. 31A1R]|uniref:Tryptophan synthase alpha chain n=1 Tax=Robertmurraya mangrovi TaxID=3098077 RepID=A0ABU5J307_9BACI|nr:tryptophan synthase subunit alpha [Bacillus sp. 31A1R]MDZ5473747.1 tryptophan synthase subunit alpha [Bacillus sp. 31A1R]
MNRIEKSFHQLKVRNEKAFVPYIMAGDGGLKSLMERILFLEKSGATAIEIGIPFSDPVADGPTIQEAGIRALKNGTTLKEVLSTIRELRPIVSIPLILMTYMNPIYAYGIGSFILDAKKSGVDGLIIPDLPIEEEEMILEPLNEASIELIRLVTLTSPIDRIKDIAERGRGFLYAVTVTGITGSRTSFNESVGEYLAKIVDVSPIPVLAGFGISTPEQVKEMAQYCDGVVVGSKVVELFHNGSLDKIEELISASKVTNVI